jgi:plastocyanin
MRNIGLSISAGALIPLALAAASARGQTAGPPPTTPHTIVVKLVEQPGPMPYAFEPAAFTAETGDTIRFVQAASVMHNVHFKSMPKGAKLGSAAVSQYLTTKGQSTSVVIDSRFSDGKYEIVCDPHEMTGMHAFLTVEQRSTAAGGGK